MSKYKYDLEIMLFALIRLAVDRKNHYCERVNVMDI
jgi:hypothetical protein